jgi:hypothetical protein
MVTIEFTRNGQTGTKKVHDFALEDTLASFRRAGYTITSDGSAPAAPVATEVPAAEQTGRVGRGHEVHRLVAGHSSCGASFRRGLNTNRPTTVTGEAITCRSCQR